MWQSKTVCDFDHHCTRHTGNYEVQIQKLLPSEHSHSGLGSFVSLKCDLPPWAHYFLMSVCLQIHSFCSNWVSCKNLQDSVQHKVLVGKCWSLFYDMESRLWTHIIGTVAVPTIWQTWQFLYSASILWMTQCVQKKPYPMMKSCKPSTLLVHHQGYQIILS
jgi:hypothetical protein